MRRPSANISTDAAVRFLAVGGANTAVTAAAFLALASVLDVAMAYTLSYAAGLIFVTYATPRLAFGTRPPARRRGALAAWYLVVYTVGLGATRVLEGSLDLSNFLVVVGTLSTTAGLGFIGASVLVGPRDEGRS